MTETETACQKWGGGSVFKKCIIDILQFGGGGGGSVPLCSKSGGTQAPPAPQVLCLCMKLRNRYIQYCIRYIAINDDISTHAVYGYHGC